MDDWGFAGHQTGGLLPVRVVPANVDVCQCGGTQADRDRGQHGVRGGCAGDATTVQPGVPARLFALGVHHRLVAFVGYGGWTAFCGALPG